MSFDLLLSLDGIYEFWICASVCYLANVCVNARVWVTKRDDLSGGGSLTPDSARSRQLRRALIGQFDY